MAGFSTATTFVIHRHMETAKRSSGQLPRIPVMRGAAGHQPKRSSAQIDASLCHSVPMASCDASSRSFPLGSSRGVGWFVVREWLCRRADIWGVSWPCWRWSRSPDQTRTAPAKRKIDPQAARRADAATGHARREAGRLIAVPAESADSRACSRAPSHESQRRPGCELIA